jgi:4-hydroxymandelate oxidase
VSADEIASRIFDHDDLVRAAEAALQPAALAYLAGGAGDESSVRRNRRSLERLLILPRAMVDVSSIDLSTEVLGIPLAFPMMIAPSALQRMSHPDGEVAVGRATAESGLAMILSMNTSSTVEEVAATGVPFLLQLYLYRDRGVTERLIERATAAGCRGIVPTVDSAVLHHRPRELRAGFERPPGVDFVHLPPPGEGGGLETNLTWEMVTWLRSVTDLPIVLKGILDPADAVRAAEEGVDGIVVSNHGGRQASGAVSAWDVLADIVDRVKGRTTILADGGVQDGSDVFRGIALGADAVLTGRAPVWGLAAAGEAGVRRHLELVRREFESVMGWTGSTSVARATRDRIFVQA